MQRGMQGLEWKKRRKRLYVIGVGSLRLRRYAVKLENRGVVSVWLSYVRCIIKHGADVYLQYRNANNVMDIQTNTTREENALHIVVIAWEKV